MQHVRSSTLLTLGSAMGLALLLSSAGQAQVITEIADSTGDGAGNPLAGAHDVAVDANGNVFVIGNGGSNNVFKIAAPGACTTTGTPCTITQIMDATGDGAGNGVSTPQSVAVDSSGNVYVASSGSSNVLRIATPGNCSTSSTPCTITQIIDSTGAGAGSPLSSAAGLAVDSSGNVYVGGMDSDNAFKIATPGNCSTNGTPCTITQIITFHGAPGGGNRLDATSDVAVDSAGNVFVATSRSDNAFKIVAPGSCDASGTPCTVTEIIDDTGDGTGNTVSGNMRIATDSAGNVYVSASNSDNAFKIEAPGSCDTNGSSCTISQIIDSTGDGAGNTLNGPLGLATDSGGNVYLSGELSNNAFRIDPPGACSTIGTPCTITQILDSAGDGAGNVLNAPIGIAFAAADTFYIAAQSSQNVLRAGTAASVPTLEWRGFLLLSGLLLILGVFPVRVPARST